MIGIDLQLHYALMGHSSICGSGGIQLPLVIGSFHPQLLKLCFVALWDNTGNAVSSFAGSL